MTGSTGARVAIGVATYRRLECLERIVPALAAQLAASPYSGEVIVVDNDPAAGARALVESLGEPSVRYSHQAQPGISAARNRAVELAGDHDVILFIDDDELPAPRWLERMVECWSTYQCAGIAGPAVAQFEGRLDPWVGASGVFDRRTLPTGTVVPGAASNNLLLDLQYLRRSGLGFDSRFGISGGSDTMLTRSISRAGGVIRWCDEAEVYDMIPLNRMTRKWVLRRIFRTSNTWSRVHLALATSTSERLSQRGSLAARGVLRLGKGLLGTSRRTTEQRAIGASAIAAGAGMLTGACGLVWHEYRRPTAA